ncbi:MAG: lactate utilization protein [Muribaculaceae bacterium]|nr:lactate utilization protein [Alistipes senegalensis]MCM1473964.1 lactate utilization protein [Muribaculaceae bacterium]
MDENKKIVIEKRIKKTGENLVKNNMEFYYAETKNDVRPIVESLLKNGDVITSGGTVSMAECGIADLLRSPDYTYLDRTGKSREEVEEIYIKAFSADVYISSSNAITEDGVLYNVDGNSNRVAAIAYGPKSVVIIAGYNKIVKNLDDAEMRVKRDAAPPNCIRLDCPTPCRETGECISLSKSGSQMTDGCSGDGRICCNYLISAKQRHKGRIKVILVGEELGY